MNDMQEVHTRPVWYRLFTVALGLVSHHSWVAVGAIRVRHVGRAPSNAPNCEVVKPCRNRNPEVSVCRGVSPESHTGGMQASRSVSPVHSCVWLGQPSLLGSGWRNPDPACRPCTIQRTHLLVKPCGNRNPAVGVSTAPCSEEEGRHWREFQHYL